jgi:hypothetical protein
MKVHELLSSPDNWTQGSFARDKNGKPVSFQSHEATCWCLIGALGRCYGVEVIDDCPQFGSNSTFGSKHYQIAQELRRDGGPYMSPMGWNDCRATHAEVLALCEKLDI